MIVVVLVFVSLRFGFHHPGCEYEFVVSINHDNKQEIFTN